MEQTEHRSTSSPAPEAAAGAPHTSITPAALAEVLRQAGYRANLVEGNAGVQLHSAVQGLGFFISFGSPLPGAPGQHLDFSFHCWLAVRGELPDAVIESWNRGKRFGRVFRQQQVLVLTMDVLVAGGVSLNHLLAQCEIWDHLVRDLMLHLRQSVQATAAVPSTAVA
jgi:hypothetical protein